MTSKILTPENFHELEEIFNQVIKDGMNFKLEDKVCKEPLKNSQVGDFIESFPETGIPLLEIVNDFRDRILPHCTNFGSPQFMGFPDAGNSAAAIAGGISSIFANQNLINQSLCSPVGTLMETAVIQWLRETVGYSVREKIENVWDVGGIITAGGTASNATGILLARENKFPNAMNDGVTDLEKSHIVVPKDIGHYSVKAAQMWAGCGNRLIEIETENYRYNLDELRGTVRERASDIMAIVAYCGDSRTMTVDNFSQIHDIAKDTNENIWLHADACHGFSLGFSPKLKQKIKGMELFDSITLDPHKVMATPYTISSLLVKDPEAFKTITSNSDLIMQEPFAFGQITPFTGSRSWDSLKLWFMMKNFGKEGLANLVEHRYESAQYLSNKLKADKRFQVINDLEINSVAFMYVGDIAIDNIEKINHLNQKIHNIVLDEGCYNLHQFSIPDSGNIQRGAIVYPLRFMTGNMRISPEIIDQMIEYIATKANSIINEDS